MIHKVTFPPASLQPSPSNRTVSSWEEKEGKAREGGGSAGRTEEGKSVLLIWTCQPPQVCTQADRSAFSNNLIEMVGSQQTLPLSTCSHQTFHSSSQKCQVSTEHASLFGSKGVPNGTIIGNARKEVTLVERIII